MHRNLALPCFPPIQYHRRGCRRARGVCAREGDPVPSRYVPASRFGEPHLGRWPPGKVHAGVRLHGADRVGAASVATRSAGQRSNGV